jgi:hypothetical protein
MAYMHCVLKHANIEGLESIAVLPYCTLSRTKSYIIFSVRDLRFFVFRHIITLNNLKYKITKKQHISYKIDEGFRLVYNLLYLDEKKLGPLGSKWIKKSKTILIQI